MQLLALEWRYCIRAPKILFETPFKETTYGTRTLVELYRLATEMGKAFPGGVLYSCAVIVGVYLWAAVHDRPTSWACRREHWPAEFAFARRLPSQSVVSR